jgi:GAF domain-containing protein
MEAPLPPNEKERLAALASFDILDSAPEKDFDDLVQLASHVCRAPIALVSLIDHSRQWFKARLGLAISETPRAHAFCAHAILDARGATLVVPDAEADDRFRDNPLVRGRPDIRFYAGSPLVTEGGHSLGTLCVIDTKPRVEEPLTDEQLECLRALSRQAVRMLEFRRVGAEMADVLARMKTLAPLVPVCSWCRRMRDDRDYWSSLEEYLRSSAGIDLTHGICPACAEREGLGREA